VLRFAERTITVSIDTDRCPRCETKACIAACRTYARGILELKDGRPSVAHLDAEGVKRGGTECLACEYECLFRGRGAIAIEVPIKGLLEYLDFSQGQGSGSAPAPSPVAPSSAVLPSGAEGA
jgi:hypothetical protein